MRKFVQSVSMPASQEQFEKDLRKPLEEMGYDCDGLNFDAYDILYAEGNDIYTGEHKCKVHLDSYNPDLFKAIAALTEGKAVQHGEWIKYEPTGSVMGMFTDWDLVDCHPSEVEKMNLEELIRHFTQPSVEVKQEWEPKNGEECEGSMNGFDIWMRGRFIGMHRGQYVIWGSKDGLYLPFDNIRKYEGVEITRSEAEQKLTELVGKTVVIKD